MRCATHNFANFAYTSLSIHSYTYDLTHTLQHNLTRIRGHSQLPAKEAYNDKWVWNRHLLHPALQGGGKSNSRWLLPLIHGFVDQASEHQRSPPKRDETDHLTFSFLSHKYRTFCIRSDRVYHRHCSAISAFCWSAFLEAWCQ